MFEASLGDSLAKRALSRSARLLYGIWSELFPSEQIRSTKRWYAHGGDQALRFNYPFNPNAVVLDVGAFEGQWASDLYARFLCKVHIFEPVQRHVDFLRNRFEKNQDIVVHAFGLGERTRQERISVNGAGSSIFRTASANETIHIVDIADWIVNNGLEKIDLIKLNIEGGEYEVLNRLIASRLIERVDYLQLQFHNISPAAPAAMQAIQRRLTETHELDFQYIFLWEGWRRKNFL